jgi:DNA repair and recombination protein RAD54B
LTLNG